MTNQLNQRKGSGHDLPGERSLWGNFLFHTGILVTKYYAKLAYKGQENIPEEAPYVLAANHQTYADGLFIASGLPKSHFEKFSAMVGADVATEHGTPGKIIAAVARPVYVNRHGGNPVRGLIGAKNACQAGNIMLVHPEGTRTHDGRLGELHSGAAYIAIKGQVPLVPVYISGGYETFSRYDKRPRHKSPITGKRNKITVEYGEPMYFERRFDAHVATDMIRDWMQEREEAYYNSLKVED